jgi:hypothetical protein
MSDLPGWPVNSSLVLDPGERVLWTGRPRSVPWWFGSTDLGNSLRLAHGKSIAQFPLITLRPPAIWGQSLLIVAVTARPAPVHYWKALTSPAAPSLIGIDDPVGVRDLICAAQLAQRALMAASKSSTQG